MYTYLVLKILVGSLLHQVGNNGTMAKISSPYESSIAILFIVIAKATVISNSVISQHHMHIHTFTYIHIYIHSHTYIYAYIHIHTCIHIHINRDVLIHTSENLHTHTNTYTHTYIHTYIHLYTLIHTYIHTYIHTHTYIHSSS